MIKLVNEGILVNLKIVPNSSKNEIILEKSYEFYKKLAFELASTIYKNNVQDKKNIGIAIEPSRFTKIFDKNGLVLKANMLYDYYILYSYRKED